MKGIMFKPESIQAIIEGRKTQTRRVIKPQPLNDVRMISGCGVWSWEFNGEFIGESKPRYQVGEVVYTKEAYKVIGTSMLQTTLRPAKIVANEAGIEYKDGIRLDKDCPLHIQSDVLKWHSPMMMPEWAARYFITITDVRAERLQEIEITPSDCIKEGSHWPTDKDDEGGFINLWNSINKDYQWEMNPWVWVYTFKKR